MARLTSQTVHAQIRSAKKWSGQNPISPTTCYAHDFVYLSLMKLKWLTPTGFLARQHDVRFSLKILLNKTKVVPIFITNTGAPNVTELTFDIESRTLTCTSTGGPATTVTWTKDGAVITPSTTHQQTQMIVDTVGGIYQNTLTIAQSVTGDNLYGLYSCIIENSRGSSNRTAFFGYGKTVVRDIYITEAFDCYTGCRQCLDHHVWSSSCSGK